MSSNSIAEQHVYQSVLARMSLDTRCKTTAAQAHAGPAKVFVSAPERHTSLIQKYMTAEVHKRRHTAFHSAVQRAGL